MVTAKVAPDISLALAGAAGPHPLGAHLPGQAVLWLAVTGLAAACWLTYRVSLWLHPFAMCRRCGGSGVITGFLPWSRAFCYSCNGYGMVPRLGTRVASLRERLPR
jgi:hypothetical protein